MKAQFSPSPELESAAGSPGSPDPMFERAPVSHFALDRAGLIQQANQSTACLLGMPAAQLPGKPFAQFVSPSDLPIWQAFLDQIFAGQAPQTCEVGLCNAENSLPPLHFSGSLCFSRAQLRVVRIEAVADAHSEIGFAALTDITEHRRSQEQRDAERELLRICHFATTTADLLRELTGFFKQLTGCQAVGVRLHQGEDYPYYETSGFPPAFVEAERHLCSRDTQGNLQLDAAGQPRLECLCGCILSERTNPALPVFTAHGSFWSGCTTALRANATVSDQLGNLRNRCNSAGYESVALIPLRARGTIYGLFQFNDPRRDYFQLAHIELLEHLVNEVALALANLQSVEALRESEEKYRLLIENSSEAIHVVQNGRFQFFNAQLEKLTGYSTAELLAMPFADLVHPDERAAVIERHQQRLQGVVIPTAVGRILDKSGQLHWVEVKTVTIQWAGQPATLNFVTDITQRKQLEEISARNEQVLRLFVEYAPASIAMFDRDMRYLIVSQRFLQDYHLKQQDILGFSHYEIFPEISPHWKEIHRRCLAGAVEKCAADRFERADGSVDWLRWEIRPWYETPERIGGILLFSEVVTAQTLAADELHRSEARFRTLAELLPIGVYLADLAGNCLYANPKWLETAGLTLEEARGPNWARGMHPEDRELILSAWERMVSSRGEWGLEYRFRTPAGKITWVYGLVAELTDEHGQRTGFVGANIDITERKRMQDSLQASLAEKDILLREVHHRVKNNLAAILGLLEMERQTAAGASLPMIQDLANRIAAMAAIHEKLYQSEHLSKIEFEDYLKSFLAHLKLSYPLSGKLVCRVEAAGVELGLDVAVPCGLIVNELVTNALKYAFPAGQPGLPGAAECQITIQMSVAGSRCSLSVADNGVGLPSDLDWRSARSMGLRLVRMLGEHQLGGKISLERTQGTQFSLVFDLKNRT